MPWQARRASSTANASWVLRSARTQTDCSVNTTFNGTTYCFGNETAKAVFLKRPEEFLTKAQVYYSSKSQ